MTEASSTEPVARAELEGSLSVPDFLAGAGTLTLAERRLIVEQALLLLEQNYVHLPLKEAMHAVNPVQRLKLLRTQLTRLDGELAADLDKRLHRYQQRWVNEQLRHALIEAA